ncbi:hypothetical protein PPROV_000942800 [Pycnococcus provasolii]|uniref:FCP1 homology domain-containing protein n=2 Tax=Pycnococcus provasolii TaxID=41880 RepID=A0A830I0M1_9CHLO|nr:hypothetical protein PPROV_000942800 [Pycnococcus provasolii]
MSSYVPMRGRGGDVDNMDVDLGDSSSSGPQVSLNEENTSTPGGQHAQQQQQQQQHAGNLGSPRLGRALSGMSDPNAGPVARTSDSAATAPEHASSTAASGASAAPMQTHNRSAAPAKAAAAANGGSTAAQNGNDGGFFARSRLMFCCLRGSVREPRGYDGVDGVEMQVGLTSSSAGASTPQPGHVAAGLAASPGGSVIHSVSASTPHYGTPGYDTNWRAIPPPIPVPAPAYDGEAYMPPLAVEDKGKKTLVLDLDETLVHSSFKPIPNPDYVIPVEIDGRVTDVYVLKRPWVDHFLACVAQRFEVVVFTASLSKYADPLLDLLDSTRCIRQRLFREACCPYEGNYVKDLRRLGRPLRDTIIVDNSPHSYIFQPDNAIAIGTYIDDPEDRELLELIPYLETLAFVDDVTKTLAVGPAPA